MYGLIGKIKAAAGQREALITILVQASAPDAKGAATWDAKDKQGNRRPSDERAAPRLLLGGRVG